MKTTKRAMLSSVIALFLCFTMLLGTTYAWFTDEVTSENNVIKSGNLDVVFEYATFKDDGTFDKWVTVEGASNILTNQLWEPGVTEVAYLRVANAGSLALKYQLGINILSELPGVNKAGEAFNLSEYIQFGVVEGVNGASGAYGDRAAAIADVADAKKISAGYTKADSLAAGANDLYLALVVWMPETVGNEANHNGTAPQINLGLNIFATQVANESDSFGPDYDENAPIVQAPWVIPEEIEGAVTLKSADNVMITLPKTLVEQLSDAGVEELSIALTAPVVDGNTVSFGAVELVDENGDIIDLAALNTTVTVTLPLPAQTFDENEVVMVYHDGAYVANAVVDANGVITYQVAHLCEITIGALEEPKVNEENNDVIEIGNVAQLMTFAMNVNAGNDYAGKTVVLTADIDLNNVAWTPIGNWDHAFAGTFDGNGKVISNLYINDAEGEGVGFFGVVEKATIKNLTIKNVDIAAYSMVAGVVGAAYPATISNCHVIGNINIVAEWAYVAGVAGYCYYGTQVDGCSTVAEKNGLIKAETRNAVGGITAWLLEGDHKVTNCTAKNLDLVGWTNIGGITGFVHYSNTISDCTVENVTLTKTRIDGNPGIGLIAGGFSYNANNASTLSNNTVKNATMGGTHVAYSAYNELYGSEYGGATTTNFVLENNTVENITNNLIVIVKVANTNELKAALKDNAILYLPNASYTLPSLSAYSGITIMGALDGTTKVTGVNSFNFGTDTIIKNVTFATSNNSSVRYATTSGDVVYENCVFEGKQYGYHVDNANNGTITFNGCTFYGRNALAASGTYFFNDCTFEYTYSNYNTTNIYSVATFNNCKWKSRSISVLELFIGDGAKAIIDGDVITQRVVFIADATGMENFQRSVNFKNESYAGVTVMLSADIDMSQAYYANWTPIGQTGATQFMGTFDGHGYTISNLKVNSSKQTGEHYSSGLFGWLNNATVKNVTLDNATIIGNHNVGVIAGYLETAGCTISNCNVTNSTITATHINDDVCGDKVGVIVGHAGNAGVVVENCSATDCTVVAGRDAGQIAGAAKSANVIGCTASNVTVTADGSCTGANVREELIGRVL